MILLGVFSQNLFRMDRSQMFSAKCVFLILLVRNYVSSAGPCCSTEQLNAHNGVRACVGARARRQVAGYSSAFSAVQSVSVEASTYVSSVPCRSSHVYCLGLTPFARLLDYCANGWFQASTYQRNQISIRLDDNPRAYKCNPSPPCF